jgi:hypothetical protein
VPKWYEEDLTRVSYAQERHKQKRFRPTLTPGGTLPMTHFYKSTNCQLCHEVMTKFVKAGEGGTRAPPTSG